MSSCWVQLGLSSLPADLLRLLIREREFAPQICQVHTHGHGMLVHHGFLAGTLAYPKDTYLVVLELYFVVIRIYFDRILAISPPYSPFSKSRFS